MAQPLVISHWYHLIEGFHFSSQDFYKQVEEAVKRRKLPEVQTGVIKASEGGLLSASRLYLRVTRGEFIFDICAAPFGTGFFVSWWLAQQPSGCLVILSGIPVIGLVFERLIKPETYYKIDTGLMFQSGVHQAVMEVVDKITHGQEKVRAITESERKPILRDFYQR